MGRGWVGAPPHVERRPVEGDAERDQRRNARRVGDRRYPRRVCQPHDRPLFRGLYDGSSRPRPRTSVRRGLGRQDRLDASVGLGPTASALQDDGGSVSAETQGLSESHLRVGNLAFPGFASQRNIISGDGKVTRHPVMAVCEQNRTTWIDVLGCLKQLIHRFHVNDFARRPLQRRRLGKPRLIRRSTECIQPQDKKQRDQGRTAK